jgi:hypothetical protein
MDVLPASEFRVLAAAVGAEDVQGFAQGGVGGDEVTSLVIQVCQVAQGEPMRPIRRPDRQLAGDFRQVALFTVRTYRAA